MDEKQWPSIGSKVVFKGTHMLWFQNIIKDANELLEIGKEYTITKLGLNSSWCSVVLEEFPDKKFALSFFTHSKDHTTRELKKAEQEIWEAEQYKYTTLEELRDRKQP